MRKTNRIVTVEEAWPVASIGSEICSSRVVSEAFDYLDAPPTKVSAKDVPMPYAANLEKLALPSVDDVVSAVAKAYAIAKKPRGRNSMPIPILMPALSPNDGKGQTGKMARQGRR